MGEVTDPSTNSTIDLQYPAGARPYSWVQIYTGTASFTLDFNPAIIRLIGTYTSSENPNPWSAARDLQQVNNFMNLDRTEMVEAEDGAINLKYTHLISANSFLEVSGGYSFSNLRRFDPYLKDRWLEYGDGKANEEFGFDWP